MRSIWKLPQKNSRRPQNSTGSGSSGVGSMSCLRRAAESFLESNFIAAGRADVRGGRSAPDRLREPRRFAGGARCRAAEGNRDPAGDGRKPRTNRSATAGGESSALRGRMWDCRSVARDGDDAPSDRVHSDGGQLRLLFPRLPTGEFSRSIWPYRCSQAFCSAWPRPCNRPDPICPAR